MAGIIKANAIQLGDSPTPAQNLVIRTNVDGTFTIARGNVGATTQDIITIDAAGNIAYPSMTAAVPFTPIVSSLSGTITTVGAASGSYRRMGKLLFLTAYIPITVNGTGAGAVVMQLPAGMVAGYTTVIAGRENNLAGSMLQAVITSGSPNVVIYKYDNSYPGANGAAMVIGGSLEVL